MKYIQKVRHADCDRSTDALGKYFTSPAYAYVVMSEDDRSVDYGEWFDTENEADEAAAAYEAAEAAAAYEADD
jgi:hypothetical protein